MEGEEEKKVSGICDEAASKFANCRQERRSNFEAAKLTDWRKRTHGVIIGTVDACVPGETLRDGSRHQRSSADQINGVSWGRAGEG